MDGQTAQTDTSHLNAWVALANHKDACADLSIPALFAQDPQRFEKHHLTLDGLLFDYSKNHVTEETIDLLCDLAKQAGLIEKRNLLLSGGTINTTENRAAFHTALRMPVDQIDTPDVAAYVQTAQRKIRVISEALRNNPEITDIVHIGIGGSDLGPHMVCEALNHLSTGPRIHFLSNVDGHHVQRILNALTPENTAFIIASKTFSTLETITNADTVKNWAKDQSTFIAITGDPERAEEWGVDPSHILYMKDWIGGRYSLWSVVGLPIAIMLGYDQFKSLLYGAHVVDQHFKAAPLARNIPVIMGLLGVWYRNFWDYRAHAILPYAQNLHRLPHYVQQLDMESNGKAAPHKTAPVVFGEPGTNAQHAFLQLLHQGTDIIPCDFITFIKPNHSYPDHHTKLLGNALAQAQALMNGKNNPNNPHKHFPGDRPSSTIILDELSPYHLGMVLALYEHKIFVQGVVWGINSFDQWGVELGKKLAATLIDDLKQGTISASHDPSTTGLLTYIHKNKHD